MPRLPALAATCAACLLAACATPGEAPVSDQLPAAHPADTPRTSTSAPARPTPSPGWAAERGQLAERLKALPDLHVAITPDGALQLVLPAADAFPRDGSEPTPPLRARLDRIAAVLVDAPRTQLLVLGHTDSIGSELYNLQLSIRRAEAVAEHLRTRGIALARLTADGRGEAEPVADNATDAGRAANRRVEILVRPPG